MSLPEFLEYKTYVDVQGSFDMAIDKDQNIALDNQRKQNGR